MGKRKRRSKVQGRKGAAAHRRTGKASKSAGGKATKRTVAKNKPKGAAVKKAARKRAAREVETTAVEVIETPTPGVITITEFEETEVQSLSTLRGRDWRDTVLAFIRFVRTWGRITEDWWALQVAVCPLREVACN
jgi:hypothetical protein